MRKIAITGRMRSGKDTVAAYIGHHYSHTLMGFGEGVADVIATYFPEAWADGKPRKHFQVIGQGFRQLNPDIWVDDLVRRMKGLDRVVVTDLRQQNEYERLKQLGFTILKVEAGEAERIERIKAAGESVDYDTLHHETEESVDSLPFDYLISNNATLDDLYRQVDWVMNELRKDEKERD